MSTPDENDPLRIEENPIGSLPDLNLEPFPKMIRPNLTQQIQARSFEKVRKFTKQIKRVINSQEASLSNSNSNSCSFDDPESSPLVTTSPLVAKDGQGSAMASPGASDAPRDDEDNGSTPRSRRSSNTLSPTKPHSSGERETHV